MPTPLTPLEKLLAAAEKAPLTAKQLGDLADLYHQARTSRLLADKVSQGHKAVESGAEALLLAQLIKQEISAAGGKLLRVAVDPDPDYVPTVKDWTKFYAHIKKTGDFDLLERRPGKAACRARWDDGKQVPGVDKFPVYKLTRNEVK